MLVGLMVAACNMFFFAVVEEGVLPHGLARVGRLLAAAGVVTGITAAADMWLPPVLTDRLLNYVIAAMVLVVAISCGIAVRRGSRVIWFYMLGWGPVIALFWRDWPAISDLRRKMTRSTWGPSPRSPSRR